MAPTDSSDLLTARQAAEKLGVSRMTILRWAERGLLEERRIPGTRWVRYSRSQVEALVSNTPEGVA